MPARSTLPPLEQIVYGPVRSRRLGVSLGINILPTGSKVCNFNCVYCQYGWTPTTPSSLFWPAPRAVADVVRTRLARRSDPWLRIDRFTLAGHGEPTLHPQFERVVEELRDVRDELSPATRLAVLSNSSTLDRESVRRGLLRLDERYMKLDAGDPLTMRRLNASPQSFDQIVSALRELPDIVIQAMFVRDARGRVDNSREETVASWVEAIRSISPKAVHVYTLDRSPALRTLRPIPTVRLEAIAKRVRDQGIQAQAFKLLTSWEG